MYTYVSDIAYSQHIALIRSITHIHTHRCPYMRHWALRMFAQGPELALPADHADMLWSNARTVLTERKVMLGTCPMCDHTLLYPSHTLSLSPPPTTSPLSLSHRHHTPPSPTDTTPAPSQRPRMTSKITPQNVLKNGSKNSSKSAWKKRAQIFTGCKNL